MGRLLRIAFLTHEPFYPPSGGGSSEAIYLVQELVRRGHRVHLFCPKVADPAMVRKEFGVELHEFTLWQMGRYAALRNFKYLAYPFFLKWQAAPFLRRKEFDLVLSQHAIAAVTAGWLKRQYGLPTVLNFLDYLTGFMETWPPYVAPPFLLKRLERFELSLPRRYGVDGVMTVSDTLADYFKNSGYPAEKIKPIYFGFDADLFPMRAARQAPPPERPVVVMHGSFDQHHLGRVALEGLAYAARRQPALVFRFVGKETPSLRAFAGRLKQAAPGANVELTGFTPYREVAKHLQTATMGIVPYEESTGTHCAFVAKIVEYLAVGLPVVSTPIQSARRYFANEPLARFAAFDGEQFGQEILNWLSVPLAQQMEWAEPASRRVRAELDWRVISRNAAAFVERVGAGPR